MMSTYKKDYFTISLSKFKELKYNWKDLAEEHKFKLYSLE
jgi:hypothetical protein